MAFEQKTWTDRVAEFINRRILTTEDGTEETVTVTRSEGHISVEGDAFNAENMNDLEQRIADEFDLQNATLNQCFQSVSDGKAAVATALTNQGVATASDATFATMASNVTTAGSARYNSGYSAGVTAADNRANANSVNYKTGYNNGYNAGVASVSLSSQAQTLNAQLNPYSNTVYTTTFSFPHGIAGVTACYAINAKTGAAYNNGTFCPVAYSISGNTISVTVYNNTAETWYTTDNIRLVVQVNGY